MPEERCGPASSMRRLTGSWPSGAEVRGEPRRHGSADMWACRAVSLRIGEHR